MKNFNNHQLQHKILRIFYRLAPFNIWGDLQDKGGVPKSNFISCLIISNKLSLLEGLLSDLSCQDFPKNNFETVIVFDEGTDEIFKLVDRYRPSLDIHLFQTSKPVRLLSDLRNTSVLLSKGEFLLFLDDDTRIFQKNFLQSALTAFNENNCDILIPQAHALYGVIRAHYDFLDKFSFTNRCSFYRRKTIEEVGGFLKGLQTYEDTELSIRLLINNPKVMHMEELNYYHPPLYFDSMRKPLAIGQTIFQIRRHYSLLVWLLVYFNALRFLPLGLLAQERWRHWFKISLGVLLYPFTGKSYYY